MKLGSGPGGLAVWGDTDDTDILRWATDGDPERWPVIVLDVESLATERFDGPVDRVLSDLPQGRIDWVSVTRGRTVRRCASSSSRGAGEAR